MDPEAAPPAVPFPDRTGDGNRCDDGEGGLGAVLAGGRGSRLGGAKPTAELAGRPLISYPLAALAAAGIEAFVVAKPSTPLRGRPSARSAQGGRPLARPTGPKTTATDGPGQRTTALASGDIQGEGAVGIGVPLVTEAERPIHPLAGIVTALRHARRPLVVLGCDFPFAAPPLLRALAEAPEPLVVPAPGGDPQPLMARWSPQLLPRLEDALDREEPLRRTVAALAPRLLDDTELAPFGHPDQVFFNVNTPGDLARAAAFIA